MFHTRQSVKFGGIKIFHRKFLNKLAGFFKSETELICELTKRNLVFLKVLPFQFSQF